MKQFLFLPLSTPPTKHTLTFQFVAIFEDLAPPTQHTARRLQEFLGIPVFERTFSTSSRTKSSESRNIDSAMSGSLKVLASFSLDDLDDETPIKLEKPKPGTSKPQVPNPRTRSSRKRKATETINIDDPSTFAECMKQIAKLYDDKVVEADDMRKIAAAKTEFVENASAENTQLRKEVENLSKQIKVLRKQEEKKEEEYSHRMNQFLHDTKANAKRVIWEARIKMAEEAAPKTLILLSGKFSYGSKSWLSSKARILRWMKDQSKRRWTWLSRWKRRWRKRLTANQWAMKDRLNKPEPTFEIS